MAREKVREGSPAVCKRDRNRRSDIGAPLVQRSTNIRTSISVTYLQSSDNYPTSIPS